MRSLGIAIYMVILSAGSTFAQSFWCPPGSTPQFYGGGNMCRCPDGSYANIDGCAQRQQQRTHPSTPPGSTRCGPAGFCRPGTKCSKDNTCIASDAVDCGSYQCPTGNRCSHGGCLPQGASQCGAGYCDPGMKCSNKQCIAASQERPNILIRLLYGIGSSNSSQALAISGNQTVSSLLAQQKPVVAPTPYGVNKMLNDPFASAPVPASKASPSASGDPFHLNSDVTKARQLSQIAPVPAQPTVAPQSAPGTYAACMGSNTFASPNQAYCEAGDYLYYKNGTIWNKRTGTMK